MIINLLSILIEKESQPQAKYLHLLSSSVATSHDLTYLYEGDWFFFHTDHLGSTSYLTDTAGNVSQFVCDTPYGEAIVDEHLTTYENPFKFSGKELDDITGLYDHGARSRNPISTLWYGIDPLFEKYPDFSPYNYCAGNPVKLVDEDGRSTHTSDDGTVVAIYDDKDLGVYRHTDAELKGFDSKTMLVNGKRLQNNLREKVGETWTPFGFANFKTYEDYGRIEVDPSAKIDFDSDWGTQKISELEEINPTALRYAITAQRKHKWDFKYHTPVKDECYIPGYGSKLYGKYASARDVGNFAAGIVKASSYLPNWLFAYGYGSYNQNNNDAVNTIGSVLYDLQQITSSCPDIQRQGIERQQRIMHGEDKLTQMGIDAGYNYKIKKK